MLKINKLKNLIKGPVYPICPAFDKQYKFDTQSTSKYVRYINKSGGKNFLVTAGTSRINLLEESELKQLNSIIVNQTNKDSIKIVSNHIYGGIKNSISYVNHASSINADAIIIYFSERYYNDAQLINFVNDICKSTNIGVMLHAVPIRSEVAGSGPSINLSIKLFEKFLKNKNFIGIKEEFNDARYRYELATELGKDMVLINAGPSMQGFISTYMFGVKAYLTSVGSFKPEIEELFYRNLIKGNEKKALEIIRKYEDFIENGLPEGWHVCMKAGLSILNLMPKYERPPLKEADKKTVLHLKKIFKKLKFI